jgi:hypothetical protein
MVDCTVEREGRVMCECADRIDQLSVLRLHPLQLLPRLVLRPLPLRRLLD